MTAPLTPRSPLGATGASPAPLASGPGVEIVERPFLAMADLRMPPTDTAVAALRPLLGFALPTTPNRLERAPDAFRLAIWLGPDEWLVAAASDPSDLVTRLAAAAAPVGGTVADVSGQRTLLELRGPRITELLSAGCSLDLHPRVFAVGHAAQAQLARVDVIVGRGAPEVYHVAVRSSFAPYLAAWLRDAIEGMEETGP